MHYFNSNYYDIYNIEALLYAIMTITKHYAVICTLAYCYNSYNLHNDYKIFQILSTHKSGVLCWILVVTGGKHSYMHGPGIGAEVM